MAITVVLLAAGYATRLYPLTADRPKALLPLLPEKTILDAVIQSLHDVPHLKKTLLVTNHRFAQDFRAWQQARGNGVEIIDDGTDSPETRLGAIRDLALARARTDSTHDLLVVGTDNLFHWSLADFVQQAQRHVPHASLALWEAPSRESARQFGVVLRDPDSRIRSLIEKSPQPPSREVALCVYYFPAPMCRAIEEFISRDGNTDAPGYFLAWLSERQPVYGVMMPGAWYDIGTLEAYEAALKEWEER